MRLQIVLAAACLTLASADLMAYQIVGSHYHVEVEPNKFIDQLVLRCEDGKEVTVPWQSKLAESCGEDLMGNVTRSHQKAAGMPADEQQKQAMLKQIKSQYNNLPDQNVEFSSGPEGVSAHFTPPMVEILKKYEACRKTHKDKTTCATERDKAMAALSEAPPSDSPAAAATQAVKDPAPAPAKKGSKSKHAQPQPATPAPAQEARTEPAAPAPAASEPATAATAPSIPPAAAVSEPAITAAATTAGNASENPTATPAPAAKPTESEARAAAEKKIGDEYASCMRNKPKFECDQARARALADLDRGPKPSKSGRAQRKAKHDTIGQPVAAK